MGSLIQIFEASSYRHLFIGVHCTCNITIAVILHGILVIPFCVIRGFDVLCIYVAIRLFLGIYQLYIYIYIFNKRAGSCQG